MKDICIVRCAAGQAINRPRLRKLLQALILQGERVNTQRLDARTTLVEIHRNRTPEPPSQVHVGEGFAYGYSGFVRPDYGNPAEFGRQVAIRAGRASVPFSPGGIAAHFYVDRAGGSIFAWPGLSNWERVYYTARDGLCVISNSALLSHGIAMDGAAPEMDLDWFDDVLMGQGSIFEHTQFAGTRVVPSRKCLRFDPDGGIHLIDWPVPIELFVHAPGSARAVADVKDELVGALGALPLQEEALFRLSCGKDSRLIAALLAQIGHHPHAVTYGTAGSTPVEIALAVGRATGIEIEVARAPRCRKSEVARNYKQQIRWADYSFLASKQLMKPAEEFDPFTCLIEGHAHHLRGGYAAKGAEKDADGFKNFHGHLTTADAILGRERFEVHREKLRAVWDDMRRTHSVQECLYVAYLDRRTLLSPQTTYRRKARFVDQVHPLMDERVILATSRGHVDDLASERLFYSILSDLAPALVEIPLHEKGWRFLKAGADAPGGVSQSNAVQSDALPEGQAGDGETSSKDKSPHKNLKVAVERFNKCKANGLPFDLGEITRNPVLLEPVVDPDKLKGSQMNRSETLDFLWKMIALSEVLGPKKPIRSELAKIGRKSRLVKDASRETAEDREPELS